MGSTFGKVRKYSLTPVDDSATPLKYSAVSEDQLDTATAPPMTKPPLKDPPPDGKPPSKSPEEPFHERVPNYGQLLPERLRYTVDNIYIPRTSTKVGRHFSSKSLDKSDPSTSFKGPPEPKGHTAGGLDSATEPRLRHKPKDYSVEDIDRLLDQIKSRHTRRVLKRRDSVPRYEATGPLQRHDGPCKYCSGYNPSGYRGQYILEADPPPYRSPSGTSQGLPFVHNPPGKHYHIIEVNPHPHILRDTSRPNLLTQNHGLSDTSRPNLLTPTQGHEAKATQTTNNGNRERLQDRPQNSVPSHNKHASEPSHKHYPSTAEHTNFQSHGGSYRSDILGEPLMHNDLRTRSLPLGRVPHQCYTIPEEPVTWGPPFHGGDMYRMNPGGFRR